MAAQGRPGRDGGSDEEGEIRKAEEALVIYGIRMSLDLREGIYQVAARQGRVVWTIAALRAAVEKARKAST